MNKNQDGESAMDYFATVARGLEDLAAEELRDLGATDVEPTFTGVSFRGDRALLYRANLWARLPFRILKPIHTCSCRTPKHLYQGIQMVDWSAYLSPDDSFAVRATGKNPQLNHSHFTALQVKNAIVDQQRQHLHQRSTIDTDDPDVSINVHIQGNHCTVSLDSSGRSLHRRGYREAVGVAPLKETLAAALIRLTGWTPDQPFYDPLCGSGTLPIEAALMARNQAPGLLQEEFAFERWPDFDAVLWTQLREEAIANQQASPDSLIWGSDRSADVIEQAQYNAQQAGVDDIVHLEPQEFSTIEPPGDGGIVLCNPPYGERVGRIQDLTEFYGLMGDVMKQRFKGWTAYILCGNLELAKYIGLKPSRRFVVYNGTIECRLLKFELY